MDESIETRIKTLNSVLGKAEEKKVVERELADAKGDWSAAQEKLKGKLSQESLEKVGLAHALADWSGDNVSLVKTLTAKADVKSLEDVALHYNADGLTELIDPNDVPETVAGTTPREKALNFAVSLNRKFFTQEPTAVLRRMVKENAINISEPISAGITNFFTNNPSFKIDTTSIYTALKDPGALNGISDEHRAEVVDTLKRFQRIKAFSPTPEAFSLFLNANLTSAFHVAQLPQSTFLNAYGRALGEDVARQAYNSAVGNVMRHENALVTMRETLRGTGLGIIDGSKTIEDRLANAQQAADERGIPIDLDTLFDDMDHCECQECTSVYSPAAYFVELLNFLRNNNLADKNYDVKGIEGTPLEKLFRRRPDLQCLELTCENTNTVLPYIDLVNEVMESFVVHLSDYNSDTHDPKQATLEAFNVDTITTSDELLAQPRNVDLDAYKVLKDAVYPFTLPYHQPIDVIRTFLNYLGTSRYEVMKTFRPADRVEIVLNRAGDAEFLGLAEEEYSILTKQEFNPTVTVAIPTYKYYGYVSEEELRDQEEDRQKGGHKGLTFVKEQFLSRTGVQYTDLVELLKTSFINPDMPKGQALAIMESIRYSYRSLERFIDDDSLVGFLKKNLTDTTFSTDDLKSWVRDWFKRIGKLIVLESHVEEKIVEQWPNFEKGASKGDVKWQPKQSDTCNLDDVRLIHLDGSPVTADEFDRMQRFIRLWRKMGWTIDETDQALVGLATYVEPGPGGRATLRRDITPDFLHELGAVKKLLDLTGLPLEKLLTFWSDIDTAGDKSLYSRLFLTRNLIAIDNVFLDKNGDFLSDSNIKLTDHLPVLMGALGLKTDDISAIMDLMSALTLQNVSALYRHALLAKILNVKVAELRDVVSLFGDPFTKASAALELFETWGKMEDAGFTFPQLNYLIRNHDDLLRPLAPTEKTILVLSKTLYDGLNAIDRDHKDVSEDQKDEITSDMVRTKAGLLFEQPLVEQIMGVLDGTTVYTTDYTTDTPPGLNITMSDSLAKKLKYSERKNGGQNANSTSVSLQVTGILTHAEQEEAKGLPAGSGWSEAIDRIDNRAEKLVVNLSYDALSGIFTDPNDVKANLLVGDVSVPAAQVNPAKPDPNTVSRGPLVHPVVPAWVNPAQPDPNTAPAKRCYFLKHFLPFLRRQLAKRFVVTTLAPAVGLPADVTDVLLSDVLVADDDHQESALTALEKIVQQPSSSTGWKGYLIPPSDGDYVFFATDNQGEPAPLTIDGQANNFSNRLADPSNVWFTDPVPKLKAGQLYRLQLFGLAADQLWWKTAAKTKALLPSSALLPDYSTAAVKDILVKLVKAALLINGFKLSAEEVSYLQANQGDFDGFDFNAVLLPHWKRLQAYAELRDGLPKLNSTLLDLFMWARNPDDSSMLSQRISDATGWKQERIEKLLESGHFDLDDPSKFRNESNLVKLKKALELADKIGVDIDRLFEWAVPNSDFDACQKIAEGVRGAVRSRFGADDWEQVVKPLNDRLREDQRQALINYLLVQGLDGVVDADSLFEFFLIDVQMGACMKTSRIKQAISTVQLFVQRCFLGLEDSSGNQLGVGVGDLDRGRWEWMQKYRVWEANRKVFLYPENWIKPELRDDKSPFYKELESELLQKDINQQTVEDALRNYVLKVNEVANLKPVGLFVEQDTDENGNTVDSKLHVFSRTRNAPYFFYYRYFDIQEKNWYPWEKVQVDIPSYDVVSQDTGTENQIIENGTYLIPVVWDKRLLIFFPQFFKKTASNPSADDGQTTISQFGDKNTVSGGRPAEFWELKMAFSEYRNGKWSQKCISIDGFYDPSSYSASDPSSLFAPPVHRYKFVPGICDDKVAIDVFFHNRVPPPILVGNTLVPGIPGDNDAEIQYPLGGFDFRENHLFTRDSKPAAEPAGADMTDFHYVKREVIKLTGYIGESDKEYIQELNSLQTNGGPFALFDDLRTKVEFYSSDYQDGLPFYHPHVHQLMSALNVDNLDNLFDYYSSLYNPSDPAKTNMGDFYGAYVDPEALPSYHELKRAYSLYNWETAFHAPMQLAERLLASQHFGQALKMCQYVFNPSAEPNLNDPTESQDPAKRCWRFPPFKVIDSKRVLKTLFDSLQAGISNEKIAEWRDKPFMPHVVARSRPVAYMKYVVMKYIEILIAYGDYYFRQNTLETIPLAIECYVMASHLYGPAGQKIPRRGKIKPETYGTLLDKWDAFGNAMVEMELIFPYKEQTPLPYGSIGSDKGLANIFGFTSTLYFCIPDNPNLKSLRDTIDDRLFKIRHCQNIDGVFQELPLFEPPIEPGLLVAAAAQGLSISSVLSDLNSPMPNYRFYYLLQKALELCSELKALGNTFLSAKEKGDGEAFSVLRAKHESVIQNLVMEVRKHQLDEAQKSLDALQQSRKVPAYRLQYYLHILNDEVTKVPDPDTDYRVVPNRFDPAANYPATGVVSNRKVGVIDIPQLDPSVNSGLNINLYEQEEIHRAWEARYLQIKSGDAEVLASMFGYIPTFSVSFEPGGIGFSESFGGSNLASFQESVARGMQTTAVMFSAESAIAGRLGGFLRQMQDSIQQANIAGHEIKNIDKQILTQQIRIDIANQEITNQQQQIDDAQEVEEFLRDKYTNQELYSWMEDSVRTLYYQAYTLAYDLAKKAERAYCFERGLEDSNFIQFGYWDASHDGLLAGERLYLGLKQLEAAYQEKRGYDFEITKHVSLRQVNPIALLNLRENGWCEFALPEVLFDMDFPGHYMRRIKSVALTVPCVVGPYTNLNCTLRLLKHEFRTSPIASSDYAKDTQNTDTRFSTVNIPITSIAVSSGQNDSGVFELNFKDERYIPFEGSGAISEWRIELPKFKQFDYDTISDVVMHVRYTAADGGDKLKAVAGRYVQDYIKGVVDLSQQDGLFAVFDLKHDFPNEWYKANNPPAGSAARTMILDNLNERLPIFTKGQNPQAIDVYLVSSTKLEAKTLTLTQGTVKTVDHAFKDDSLLVGMKSFLISDITKDNKCPMDSWQLKIQDLNTALDKLWLLVRYILTP